MRTGTRVRRRWLGAILVLAALLRLYHLGGPLLDQMYVKQVYVANKARGIAQPPLNPLRSSLDFLDDDGRRMALTEEVPLYTGLLGAAYRAFGEHEWLGRLGSLAATLVAIVGLYDLLRREYDDEVGLVAALLFAASPLMIFYGRAVMPDPAMLACMLWSAALFRRYLDEGQPARLLVAAAGVGLLGALFKYYGLMVLVPMADMARRRGGLRAVFRPRLLAAAAAMTGPILLWMVAVFAQTANPTQKNPYLTTQVPGVLLDGRLYECLSFRFFIKDCGPIAAALVVAGAWAVATRRARGGPLVAWSIMGLSFALLFGPKLLDHDYYELMMLPAAAGWGALGWRALWGAAARAASPARLWRGAAVLAMAAVLQSPLVMASKFELEVGHAVVAGRLRQLCPPGAKVAVLGQRYGWPVVHYCGREGFVNQCRTLPDDWRAVFDAYRDGGARCAAIYFDPTVDAAERASYRPLWEAFPVVEHRVGPWFRNGRPCEYYILDLAPGAVAIAPGRNVKR